MCSATTDRGLPSRLVSIMYCNVLQYMNGPGEGLNEKRLFVACTHY